MSSIVQSFTPHTAQGDTGSDAVHARVSEYEVFASDPDAPVQSRPEVQQTTEFSADFPLENTRPVEKIKEPGGGPAELAIVMPDSVDADRASTDMSDALPAGQTSISDEDAMAAPSSGDSLVELSMIHPRESGIAIPVSDNRSEDGGDASIVHLQDNPPEPPEKTTSAIQRERRAKVHLQNHP